MNAILEEIHKEIKEAELCSCCGDTNSLSYLCGLQKARDIILDHMESLVDEA